MHHSLELRLVLNFKAILDLSNKLEILTSLSFTSLIDDYISDFK